MAPQTAITINGQSLPVREFKGQRVVTVSDVAQLHCLTERNVRRNFQRNKKHFVHGIDYFTVTRATVGYDNLFLSKKVNHLNVFTESGYLMLSKSLTDDLSWQVQRELVNGYFKKEIIVYKEKPQEGISPFTKNISLLDIWEFLPIGFKEIIFYRIWKQLTIEETSRILDISVPNLRHYEKRISDFGFKFKDNINYDALEDRRYEGVLKALMISPIKFEKYLEYTK